MSLRKILLLPLVVSALLFAYYSSEVSNSLHLLVNTIELSAGLVVVFVFSILLQLVGHVLRAYKARLVLMDVKESSTRFQFRALTIGYLFNTLLPFRLGELIRSRIIAGGMSISFSLALALIIFERAIDALILGSLGLLLFGVVDSTSGSGQTGFALSLIVVGVILIVLLALLTVPERHIRRYLYTSSVLFNDQLKTSFRFKAWSVIYGLQRTIAKPKILVHYLTLSLSSWLAYGLSVYLVVQYFFDDNNFVEQLVATIAPYFGVAIPAGPANLGTFSESTSSITGLLTGSHDSVFVFTLVAWGVLVLPTAAIGLLLLVFKTRESFWDRLPKERGILSTRDKLDRTSDISTEMSVFLENYFAGNSLTTIVHKLEVKGNFRLLKYFKGGSDAITILVAQDGKSIVKKIIPLEFEDRLRAQYDWLAEYRKAPNIVHVLGDTKTAEYYTIDMPFNEDDVSLFEYIHNRPYKKSQAAFDSVWAVLSEYVHTEPDASKIHRKNRDEYIKKHILGCLEKAGAVDPELLRAAEPDVLVINGKEYDNLSTILEKIKSHQQAWSDIATYSESKRVHGDVIVDNLLVDKNTEEVLIIDPAPDGNIINGKVFDFGKNMQSLYCGYEFLLRDESPVYLRDDNRIDYADASSAQYAKLYEYVRNELAPKHLSEPEQRAMLFHAAALFIRRLKHQVYYTPANALKFYAVGVKTLNDFLAQYDETPPTR